MTDFTRPFVRNWTKLASNLASYRRLMTTTILRQNILDLTSRAYELFKSSEVEEKRQLIKLILSNLELNGEKLVWQAHKPFDLILEMNDCQLWCARQDSNLRPTD
jgi:hypothetical protein